MEECVTRITRVLAALWICAIMIASGFVCYDADAKGKYGGGGGGLYNKFVGKVVGDVGLLEGIQIDIYWAYSNPTNPYFYRHQVDWTDENGLFDIVPWEVSPGIEYHVYVGSPKADGWWTEHRVCYLPMDSMFFILHKDGVGYVYPFQFYGNTNHVTAVSLVKELTETWTVESSVNDDYVEINPLAYLEELDYTETVNYGLGYSGAPSLICRVPYYVSGEVLALPDGTEKTVNGCFVAGKVPGAVPEWGNFLDDFYDFPVGAQTDWISPGMKYFQYRDEASQTYCYIGARSGSLWLPPFGYIWLGISIFHDNPKSDSVYWEVTNLDVVPHRYYYYYEGDITHVSISPEVYPG